MSRLVPSLLVAFTLALPAAAQERLKVATTFTIIADMAQNVAGDAADVVSLIPAGAEVHNFQPTPSDILAASDADLILWNGLGLEAWFERFFRNLGDVPAVVLTDGIEPIPISEGPYAGRPNPHAWMSLSDALIYVENIRAALAAADPANAAAYEANAMAYSAEIEALAAPIRERLAAIPEARRWLATSEGAFAYLTRDFGLGEIYIWPINEANTGTPQQIRRAIDRIREHDVPAVFSESTVDPRSAQQVARETGVAYGGVLYVDSLSEPGGPVPHYLDLMRVTTTTVAEALAP
ncbi:metal ABC transporter substrate-binding protein [Amaricoccus sp.]|uniref:metal ABC transporter substrate-binding protein n=1 Tax=Amaricoccus sp. TaxID=1872485 RepID=UPI001B58CD55|nr:metal ABC transporter substrate-binding protein [Amaricoccus sp.]MBP7001943.1 metal ABC transporter substrate-binding protein [Amaricoccus sp.]